KLASVLSPGNAWAREAPVLGLSIATVERDGRPNRHAWHDVGLSDMSLVIQAVSMGLAVHMMAGFDAEKAGGIFAVRPDCPPVGAIAIGYPGDANSLPEDIRKKDLTPRQRRPISEFVFQGKFGQPAPAR